VLSCTTAFSVDVHRDVDITIEEESSFRLLLSSTADSNCRSCRRQGERANPPSLLDDVTPRLSRHPPADAECDDNVGLIQEVPGSARNHRKTNTQKRHLFCFTCIIILLTLADNVVSV
jgi:hypothetical protein